MREENKLIAEFMGLKYTNEGVGTSFMWNILGAGGKRCHSECLEYNSSWDWLMPVVEKIESFSEVGIIVDGDEVYNFTFQITGSQCYVIFSFALGDERDALKLHDCRNTSKIEATYKAVIEFIKWYNEKA